MKLSTKDPELFKGFQTGYKEVNRKIKIRESQRDEKRLTEDDIIRVTEKTLYFVEHLDELVFSTTSSREIAHFWELIF